MRRITVLVLFLVLTYSSAQAQTWTRLQSWGFDLETLFWVNDSVGFAAGEDLLIKSQDRGATWTEVDYLPTSRILDLVFINESIGLGVGENGGIIRTSDAGETWMEIDSGLNKVLASVAFFDESFILISGEDNTILSSSDQGMTWNEMSTFPTFGISSLAFLSQDSIFVAGQSGRLELSADKGANWTPITSPVNEDLNKILFSGAGIGFAVGQNGIIIRSEDRGETWSPLASGVTVNLKDLDISPANSNIVTIVGDEATAIRSTNGGATFGQANLGADNERNLNQIKYFPSINTCFAVGQDGYLISSINGGASWSTTLAGIRNDFTDIDFKTDRFGFFSGSEGALYLTGNAGLTIANRPTPEPIDIISIDFWNTGFGYVSSAGGRMFRTTNSGRTWVDVSANTSEAIGGFYLFAPSVAYLTGSTGYIARSFDSGVTWDDAIDANTSENLRDITFFDFQVGFAMGDNGQISWSNGGNDWENIPKLTDQNLNALAKLDTTKAVVVGDHGVILKTEDKAKTWRIIEVPFTENITDVDFWDDQLGLATGDNGFSIQTKDGGETWTQIDSGTRSNLTSVSIATPLVAFAVGEDGTFLNYTCFPPGALSEITGASISCLGTQEYFIDEPQVEGAFIEWRVDGGEILSGQGTSRIEVAWERAGRNAVLVSNENFCGNGETSSMEVNVSDIPPSNLQIQGLGSVCTGGETEYQVASLPDVAYQWSVSGGFISSGQGSSSIVVIWEENGLQELSLVMENFCGKSDPILLPVQVNSAPDQPSEISGDILVGLGEALYEIQEISGINYTWEIPASTGIILSGQGTARISVEWEEEGEHILTVTPRNECNEGEPQTLAVTVDVISSVEPNPNQGLRIFPNPSDGKISITANDLGLWNTIDLISSQGQVIRHHKISPGMRQIQFDNLPTGLLFIRLSGQKSVFLRKVVVR